MVEIICVLHPHAEWSCMFMKHPFCCVSMHYSSTVGRRSRHSSTFGSVLSLLGVAVFKAICRKLHILAWSCNLSKNSCMIGYFLIGNFLSLWPCYFLAATVLLSNTLQACCLVKTLHHTDCCYHSILSHMPEWNSSVSHKRGNSLYGTITYQPAKPYNHNFP